MTSTKLYEELKKMEEIFNKANQIADLTPAYTILQDLILSTENNIMSESNKSSGNLSVGKAAIKILEYAEKHTKYKDILSKAYRTDKYLDICDSFRLVRFNLSSAPTLPEHPSGFDRYPDAERFIPKSGYSTEVELPSAQDLTTYIKIQRAQLKSKGLKTPVVYTVESGEHRIFFQADFLLTMIQCLPNARALICDDYPENKCMMFQSDKGIGLLYPWRKAI